jgi:phenylpropionate dioxygenase-like ring-hydroxylating dioxygenase large terminal subunit
MTRPEQMAMLKRLLRYVETRTTALAEAPLRNAVAIYADPAQAARERQRLFREHPLLMGFSSDWASEGAFRTEDHAGVPILIVRGAEGKLRAFLNVCRHRGAKVAQGCGHARLFACPYHAWTYEISGRLRGIPDARNFPGAREERPSLAALPLAEKYGLVWVIPSPAADGAAEFDIDPWLSGLGPELETYGFAKWSFFDRRLVPERMNWKLLVDTFHELYHVGFLHRNSLGDIFHGNIADFEAFGSNHRLVVPRKKLEHLKHEPEHSWDLMWNTAIVYALFPNTILLVQGDHVELARIFPDEDRVDRALMDLALYVPKAPTSDEERTHWDRNMQLVLDVVTGEDFPQGRAIQQGVASGAQSHVIYGRNEPGMIHYHRSLRTVLQPAAAHDE